MSCLLVSVGVLDQVAVIVRPAYKADARRQIVARESRGYDDGRHKDQERVEMRRAFLIDKRRVDTVLDQGRLVLYRLMHDGVQAIIRHDL